ncbi:potassium-transporting ATPase subunit KdpC [Solimicrobium silvestre]|uniref:Potassium-transporting ATPase KdpC subunit n=1 Tax=Solimicrobium silvestre TaxID=2099400 RepID=A0A2S9GTX7_9BURK|nr:potassium-transporting ATPase subunit KdpC [Solimicrobium silvestre]PRC91182.1 kdpC: K+-transporting ATPase, C subunit [Solimicrobium silvestre]
MKTLIRPAVSLFVVLSILVGLIYPMLTTGIGKVVFSDQANGSLIEKDHKIVGSSLIGQNFSGPGYFWGRPSATSPMPYNGLNSGGSNFGPSNPAQKAAVADRIKALHDADPSNTQAIPVDLVTASGSGLDPQISPAAINYQLQRVAKARNINPEVLKQLVAKYTEAPQLGIFGEARVNVLQLNLALDIQK